MTAPEDGGVVGQSLPKIENLEKVSGRAVYIADLTRPRMLHGALLGSPFAHARIKSIFVEAALAAPGVVAIITGEDVGPGRMGPFIKDEGAIAQGKVRYLGEPVAAVAAESEAEARAACSLIEVDYEELPELLSPDAALAEDAPAIHEDLQDYVKIFDSGSKGNLCSRSCFEEGDVEAAWADCDLILEDEFTTQAQAHVAIEPCGAIAEVDRSGRVTLWSANQSVFRVQANVSECLSLPMSRLRCLTPQVGGGFGIKMEAHVQPIAVALAMKAGRPVKIVLTREEDFEITRARHPFRIRMKTGAKRDGTLVARECEVVADCGAYADDSPGVLGYSLLMARGPYRIANVKCLGQLVYTNKLRFGAYRGFGNPQVTFAGEQHIDEIGRRLGLDPFEIRRRNMVAAGEPWFLGGAIASCGLAECLDTVEREAPALAPAPKGKRRGRGLAINAHISGLLGTGAIVRMLEDGSIVLNTGATDIGQGSDTVLAQICAETLKVPLSMVKVASPDTDGSPFNWGTTASRVTYTTGRAVIGAAKEVERQIKEQAGAILECEPADLDLRPGGRVGVVGSDRELPFAAVSGRAHWAAGGPIIGSHSLVFDGKTFDPKRGSVLGLPFPQIGVFSFIACLVDVEVDEASGQVTVLEAWNACDVGRAINPKLVEVQLDGGFVQGLGFALFEEMVWDGPRLANPSLMDYKIPTSRDVPLRLHSFLIEEPEPDGPYGAKGVGEIGINAVPAAIANAATAALGHRFRDLPLTGERVLDALLESET